MIYKLPPRRDISPDKAGFTLIEVIVGLLIVAVLAAMIYQTTGGGLWRSAQGVGECRTLFELQGEMEHIVAVYKQGLKDGGGNIDLTAFRDAVLVDPDIDHVDTSQTGYLNESEGTFSLTASPTKLLLVTLAQDDQRIASIFGQK